MTTTTPATDELTTEEQQAVQRLGFDAKAAWQEAIGPKRVRRRIWIDRGWVWLSVDGEIRRPSSGLDDIDREVVRQLSGQLNAADDVFSCPFTPRKGFDTYVAAHVRHGWTIEAHTPFEALFSKEAP